MNQEKISFLNPRSLPDIGIMSVENSNRVWRAYHETYSICTVLKGYGTVNSIYRRRHHETLPNNVVLMEPGEVHINKNNPKDDNFRVMFIPREIFKEFALESGIPSEVHFKLFNVST